MHRLSDWDISQADPDGPRMTGSDLFLLTISLLSLLNVALMVFLWNHEGRYVVLIVDGALAFCFLVNFFVELIQARNKRLYFFQQGGWLDLLSGIPIPGFRLFQVSFVIRDFRLIRKYGLLKLLKNGGTELATISLIVAVFLTFCVVEFGSIWIIHPERNAPGSNIHSASDAIWWSYVTITTVGYGDEFPVTPRGRVIGVLMLTIGVLLFATITGFVANSFTTPRAMRKATERRNELHRQELRELKHSVDLLREEIEQLRSERKAGLAWPNETDMQG